MNLIRDLGMLFAKEDSKKPMRYGLYLCPVCLKEVKAVTSQVKNKRATKCKSCAMRIAHTKHGQSSTPLNQCWRDMKARCYNPNNKHYNLYGGRGVKVCEEWIQDFKPFYDWAITNGYEQGLQLDKDILSKQKNIQPPIYSPETCMFVTPKQNSNNKRKKHES